MFQIGEKIRWTIGRENNPIVLRGLYIEQISESSSEVLIYEQNGLRRKAIIEVETRLLEKDEE